MGRTLAKAVEHLDFKILNYNLETPFKHKSQLNQEFKSWGTIVKQRQPDYIESELNLRKGKSNIEFWLQFPMRFIYLYPKMH